MRSKLLLFVFLITVASVPGFAGVSGASNARVAAEVQDKLYHAGVFKHGAVKVDVQNGVARLTGTVDSVGVRNDAANAARKVDHVASVQNDITVHADDLRAPQIAARARNAIVTYPFYTIFDNVELRYESGTLTVSGQVTQPFKKSDIGNLVAHVAGVAALDNELEVLPNSVYDDQIRRAVARSIYRDPFFANYINQALPPIHIIVKDGNVSLVGVVDTPLARLKAGTDARFAATYFGLANHLRVEG